MEVLLVLVALCLIVHLISKINVGEESTPKPKNCNMHSEYVGGLPWVGNNRERRRRREQDDDFNDDFDYDSDDDFDNDYDEDFDDDSDDDSDDDFDDDFDDDRVPSFRDLVKAETDKVDATRGLPTGYRYKPETRVFRDLYRTTILDGKDDISTVMAKVKN